MYTFTSDVVYKLIELLSDELLSCYGSFKVRENGLVFTIRISSLFESSGPEDC